MNLGELTRQYQMTLESARRTRTEFGGTLSAEDLLEEADRELRRSRGVMENAWDTAEIRRILT